LKKLSQIAVKYSSRPISLKIRTGFEKPVNIKRLTGIINNSGIELLIIHARTVLSKFNDETLDLDTVKKIKEKIKINVVGNGNIINPITAKRFIEYTKVDAFMIGRESMGNPEIFNQIHEFLVNNKIIFFRNNKETMEKNVNLYENSVDEFLNGILHPLGNGLIKFMEMKRNSIWLSKNIDKSTQLRYDLSKAKDLTQLKLILSNFFNSKS
ncbi:MAG: tRNA-dihydrouridine synthase, partial [Candidatus Odinarchaeota archaeon]